MKKLKPKKEVLIKAIQDIVKKWGSFNVNEVEHETSPVISCIGDHSVMVERINEDDVDTGEYVGGISTHEGCLSYEELREGTLEEILRIAENYEVDCNKAFERSQD